MDQNERTFKGIYPVLITPYNDDLTIDFNGYQKMIEWYMTFNLGGIYANCQSSEMFELTEAERLKLISDAVKIVNGKIPVVGTGNFGKNVNEHLEFIKKVSDTGADIVMLTVPEYLNTDEELEKYYLTIAEKTNIKLGVYECPVPRRYYLGFDLIKKIAETGKFFAYKETSCELDKIKKITDITSSTNFAHLQANVPYLLESIKYGTPGSMNIAANWMPDLVVKVYELGKMNDPLADKLNNALCGMEMAQRSVHPMGVKYLISKRGVPIKPLTRYPRKLSLEEIYGLELAAKHWFTDDGKLKILLDT